MFINSKSVVKMDGRKDINNMIVSPYKEKEFKMCEGNCENNCSMMSIIDTLNHNDVCLQENVEKINKNRKKR